MANFATWLPQGDDDTEQCWEDDKDGSDDNTHSAVYRNIDRLKMYETDEICNLQTVGDVISSVSL